jgi:hypothetical protein
MRVVDLIGATYALFCWPRVEVGAATCGALIQLPKARRLVQHVAQAFVENGPRLAAADRAPADFLQVGFRPSGVRQRIEL